MMKANKEASWKGMNKKPYNTIWATNADRANMTWNQATFNALETINSTHGVLKS